MIKIVKIESEGGACPYQIEALTDDNRPVYVRFRHGHGRVEIGKPGAALTHWQEDTIFQWDGEDGMSGWSSYSEIRALTKDIIEWPEYENAQENLPIPTEEEIEENLKEWINSRKQ